jgi:3-oxoacyl-[acyl-carrier-protein] synthase II
VIVVKSSENRPLSDVVVTGLGVMTPGGVTVEAMWDFLLSGRSAAVTLDEEVVGGATTSFACVVSDYDEAAVPSHQRRKLDRSTRLAAAAADQAISDAGLTERGEVAPERVAVVIGVGIGGLSTIEEQGRALLESGFTAVSPFAVSKMMPNAASAYIAIKHGWRGPCLTVSTACASGANAIGEGTELIRRGAADVVVAGGAEAIVNRTALAAFGRMTALSRRNDDPGHASRPFDRDRDGFVLGDGAAMLILESGRHARDRQVRVRGRILGYAASSDAHDLVFPSIDGEGAARCMEAALTDAGLAPSDIGHISAHGTSTPLNDVTEAKAIETVFHADIPPVTSCKGALGHSIGGAGAVEAVAALLGSRTALAPPTANCERIDPLILVDVVQGAPRSCLKGAPVLSNSFGFGGHNACLVISGSGADG